MDLEAPVDAWYVWFGVVILSLAFLAVAVGMPSSAPPDADGGAATIDRVASNQYAASATFGYDAEEIRIETSRIEMKNSAGTDTASTTFGTMTPVHAHPNETRSGALEELLYSANVTENIGNESELRLWAEETRTHLNENEAEWRPASDELKTRQMTLDGEQVVLVAV